MDLTPYKNLPYGEGGVDCYGLVRMVLADAGIQLPAYNVPEADADRVSMFRDKLRELAAWKPVRVPRPLDLVVFTAGELHIGLVVGRGRYLHASKVLGRSVISRWGDGFASTPAFYRYAP